MTWIDDDEREYTGPMEAAKGGWKLLNREERIAFKFLFFVSALLILLSGMEVGHHVNPNEPLADQIGDTKDDSGDKLDKLSNPEDSNVGVECFKRDGVMTCPMDITG